MTNKWTVCRSCSVSLTSVHAIVCTCASAVLLWFAYGATTVWAEEVPAQLFDDQVKPILISRCLPCHGTDHKGGLDLAWHAAGEPVG